MACHFFTSRGDNVSGLEAEVLRGHLASCVPTGFKQGRNEAMISELSDLFELARK